MLIRLAIIEAENRQIEREIAAITTQAKPDEIETIEAIVESTDTPRQPKTGHRRVPGLTLAEETNLKSLEKYRDFLREKHSRLEENASTKYTLKEKRVEMQNLFDAKQTELDQERERRLTLRNRLRLYHLVLRTIKKYIEDENAVSTPRTESQLLEDVILKAIYESINLFRRSMLFFDHIDVLMKRVLFR